MGLVKLGYYKELADSSEWLTDQMLSGAFLEAYDLALSFGRRHRGAGESEGEQGEL